MNRTTSQRRSHVGAERLNSDEQHACIFAFHTQLNWMAVATRNDAVCGIVFGHASCPQAEAALLKALGLPRTFCRFTAEGQPGEPAWLGELVDGLRRFAAGEPVDFSDVPLELGHLTPLARRVVAECRRVPWGRVQTYGELAAACGRPAAARAVGSVMAKNRFPLVVPCHRVIGAAGALGGYSAPQGLQMKRRLLAIEGVRQLQGRQQTNASACL